MIKKTERVNGSVKVHKEWISDKRAVGQLKVSNISWQKGSKYKNNRKRKASGKKRKWINMQQDYCSHRRSGNQWYRGHRQSLHNWCPGDPAWLCDALLPTQKGIWLNASIIDTESVHYCFWCTGKIGIIMVICQLFHSLIFFLYFYVYSSPFIY